MHAVENRGKDPNPKKISNEVWNLVKDHWSSMQHKKSHYDGKKTERKFFTNTDLTVKKLHSLFLEFHKEKTGQDCKLEYKVYHKYFREKSEFSIRQRKTDVCDYCTECTVKLSTDPHDPCAEMFQNHKRDYEEHSKLRNHYTSEIAKEASNKTLVCEFDYAQNLALPKLNVNSQYYKRQLNLYVFNVHCFNDETSEFYCFLECEGSKNANSVCSFLYESVSKQLEKKPDTEKVIFLSDSCGGQNKNKTVVRFCSWLSVTFNITIIHIFPIRGHSYCQCDRNFGCYGTILKRKEIVETPSEYLEIMRSARAKPSSFTVGMAATFLEDWGSALEPLFLDVPKSKTSTFSIQKYVKLEFKPTRIIIAHKKYKGSGEIFPYFKNNANVQNLVIEKLRPLGINEAKKKDLLFLMRFLKPTSRSFYHDTFEACKSVTDNEPESESEEE